MMIQYLILCDRWQNSELLAKPEIKFCITLGSYKELMAQRRFGITASFLPIIIMTWRIHYGFDNISILNLFIDQSN